MSRGQPRLRSQTARRTFEKCQNSDNTKDAIIIDDDIDNVDVVLLDNPNISHDGPENAKTTRLNCLHRGVICIDDEVEVVINSSGDPVNNQVGEEFSSLSSSEDLDGDECLMFAGNGNFYHDHIGPSRNRYGLSIESECSTTESSSLISSIHECDDDEVNSSDCEIIEDHSGNIRELWEKAAFRKKESGRFASLDQATASGTTANPEGSSNVPPNNADTGNFSDKALPNLFEEKLTESLSISPQTPHNAEDNPAVNVFSSVEHETISFKTTVNISVKQSGPSSHIPHEVACNWKKDDKSNQEKCSETAQSMDDGLSFLHNDEQMPIQTSFCTNENHGKTSYSDIEEPCSRACSDSPTWDGKQLSTDDFICQEEMEKNLGKVSYNTQPKFNSVSEHEALHFKESKRRDSGNASHLCSEKDEEPLIYSENYGVHGNFGISGIDKADAVFVKSDVGLTSQNEPDDTPHSYKGLICEREKHKETDEYKRAAEEEWASRQQQLQIQAEEAQRMRKRRKAENLRLRDMEKRQKQRLEEVRELQKKDMETTQLKEQIRTAVRKDLEMVEMKYKDMASVLRALGIHVKGGHFPMLHEVNAAYKQALLRFHPDRASRADIRRQVEAEEKFKLISRLKEKLLP